MCAPTALTANVFSARISANSNVISLVLPYIFQPTKMAIILKVIEADHFLSCNSLQFSFTNWVPYLNLAGSESFPELGSDILFLFMKQI